MTTFNSILHKKRLASAEVSQGISAEQICRTVSAHLLATQLKGDLLEFGAGTGSLVEQIYESGFSGNITAADILPRPEHLHGFVKWVQSDLNYTLDVADNSFDVISVN